MILFSRPTSYLWLPLVLFFFSVLSTKSIMTFLLSPLFTNLLIQFHILSLHPFSLSFPFHIQSIDAFSDINKRKTLSLRTSNKNPMNAIIFDEGLCEVWRWEEHKSRRVSQISLPDSTPLLLPSLHKSYDLSQGGRTSISVWLFLTFQPRVKTWFVRD